MHLSVLFIVIMLKSGLALAGLVSGELTSDESYWSYSPEFVCCGNIGCSL